MTVPICPLVHQRRSHGRLLLLLPLLLRRRRRRRGEREGAPHRRTADGGEGGYSHGALYGLLLLDPHRHHRQQEQEQQQEQQQQQQQQQEQQEQEEEEETGIAAPAGLRVHQSAPLLPRSAQAANCQPRQQWAQEYRFLQGYWPETPTCPSHLREWHSDSTRDCLAHPRARARSTTSSQAPANPVAAAPRSSGLQPAARSESSPSQPQPALSPPLPLRLSDSLTPSVRSQTLGCPAES